MSQQPPPTHPRATRTFAEDDAPTVSLRATATYGPPPTHGPPPTLPGGGRPGGTNTMAILSLVFAVLFSPLGIVFGILCPGYLPAQVDASTVCTGGVDGQQAQLRTLVTAVEGSEATVDITRVG